MPLNRNFDSLSFYGFGIRCTPWRPCDSMAKKRQSPNHLRRVFRRLSRCSGVIRINCESLGLFRWHLTKTPGQIEGMTNRKRADFSLEIPLATTGNHLLRITSYPPPEKLEASVCCSQLKGILLSRRARRTAGSPTPILRKRKTCYYVHWLAPVRPLMQVAGARLHQRKGHLRRIYRRSTSACRMAVLHVPTRQTPQGPNARSPILLRYLNIRHAAAVACVR